MIITCSNCGTRYQADASLFTPNGRQVRCAKCGNAWQQMPIAEVEPAVESAPPAPPQPEPQPPPPEATQPAPTVRPTRRFVDEEEPAPVVAPSGRSRPQVHSAPPRESTGGRTGWLAFGVIVMAILGGLYLFRNAVVEAWPQTASLYGLLGIEINTMGLDFRDVTFEHATEDGAPVLVVKGVVVNIGNAEMAVPKLRVAIRDQEKRELYAWTFDAGIATLAPGDSRPFTTRAANPPAGGYDLQVSFDLGA